MFLALFAPLEKFSRLDNSEKMIALLRQPQTAKQEGDMVKAKTNHVLSGKNAISAEMWETSLLGVVTVLRLEREAWSMVK